MEKVKLKDICSMQSGGTPSRSKSEFYTGNIPWAKISDLEKSNDGYIYETEEHITEEALKSINNRFFKVGTLLLAMYGSVGKTAIAKIDLSTNQAILGINIIDKNNVDIKYLRYWFTTIKEQLLNRAVGAALANISLGIVKELEIPLPNLATQQRIATILDQANAIIQNNRGIVQKYDALTQSLFLDMFGDPVKNEKGWEKDILGNHCSKIQIGPFGSQLHLSDYVENGIPLVNPTNIKKDSIDYNNSVKITEEKYNSLPNYHLKNNDVIMSRRGDLSKIGIVNKEKSFCGTGSLFLRLKNTLNPLFCYFMLSHKSTIDVLYEKAQGITMPNLNKNIIVNIRILIPSSDLQNQFAERVAIIETQKQQAQLELAKSEALFQSLLQKAFKGELN